MKGWLNPTSASADMPTGNLKRGKLVFILMRSASEHVNQYL
jgi:hypothetical protein